MQLLVVLSQVGYAISLVSDNRNLQPRKPEVVLQQDQIGMILLGLSVVTILFCCSCSSYCVRAARDSQLALNMYDVRKKYARNIQLYYLATVERDDQSFSGSSFADKNNDYRGDL